MYMYDLKAMLQEPLINNILYVITVAAYINKLF